MISKMLQAEACNNLDVKKFLKEKNSDKLKEGEVKGVLTKGQRGNSMHSKSHVSNPELEMRVICERQNTYLID